MKKPVVDIVILNYNGRKIVPYTLPYIKKLRFNGKINVFIVDNGSTDDSVNYIKKNFPWIRVIENKTNLGTPGLNKALQYLKGDYIFISSEDLRYDKNCIKNMVDYLEKHPETVHVAPMMFDYKTKKEMNNGSAFSRSFYQAGYRLGKIREPYEVCTVAVGIVRNSYLKKQPYMIDPAIFLYAEDVEFGLRLRLQGKNTLMLPKAKVYHFDLTMTQKNIYKPLHTYFVDRHLLLLFLTFPRFYNIVVWLPYLLLIRLLAIVNDIFHLRPTIIWARIKAILWVLMSPILIIKKRKEKQAMRKAPDAYVFALCDEKKFLKKMIFGYS